MNTNIKQHDISDCAAACIASVAKWYGRNIPLTIIREASGTGQQGTSIKGIIDACAQIGFNAKGYKSPDKGIEPLIKVKQPIILHTIRENGDLHFVVLYGINHKRGIIMDPADGTHHKTDIAQLQKEWSGYLVILTPDPDFKVSYSTTSVFTRYWNMINLVKSEIILSLLGALVYIIIGISTSLFLQHIIDNVIPDHNVNELAKVATVMTVLMISSLFIGYYRVLLIIRAGIVIDSRLILKYIGHLLKLPLSFFTQRGTGELNSRISDAMKIRDFLTEGITGLFISVITLCVSFVLMFTFHWKLALLTLSFFPLYVIIYLISNKINKKVNREIIESAAHFEEKTVETIAAVRSIKYFGNEEYYFRSIEKQYVRLADKMYRGGRFLGLFSTSSEAVSKMLTIVLLIAGSFFIFNGGLSVGELVSFYSLTAYFSTPLSQLVSINNEMTEAHISSERLFEIIDLEQEGAESFNLPLDRCHDLIFNNVTFAYPGCEPLLTDFNLTIRKGEITAIRGESGCGKSSLAALIMRGFKTQKGNILINGTDINLIDISRWRNYVSIVPQESDLMNCTILENITCFETEPDVEYVIGILNTLGLNRFITSLPMGVLTKIGENGSRLSGGQRQRIALARALYKRPEILILDEATSSLDNESQQYILDTIVGLRNSGKSIIMITHKNDNIQIADTIITMSAHS
ncbi:MAG: peptidase domain-containing ABC transporter [Bacteroidales bacterium]|nr:peptidase domain-containing ABC transporter [Bacteroidales bacterium]MDD4669911.1 peptidase domain-containing ABC transporter [Bacteroidales bacterium]